MICKFQQLNLISFVIYDIQLAHKFVQPQHSSSSSTLYTFPFPHLYMLIIIIMIMIQWTSSKKLPNIANYSNLINWLNFWENNFQQNGKWLKSSSAATEYNYAAIFFVFSSHKNGNLLCVQKYNLIWIINCCVYSMWKVYFCIMRIMYAE